MRCPEGREKYTVKEVGKPFKVRVSARRYTGYTKSSYFAVMGGLYALAIGADRMRTITTKVILNSYLNYGVRSELEDFLKHEGFEPRWNPRVRFPWSGQEWIREEVQQWSTHDPEELKERVKNYVAGTRAEIKRELQEVIDNYMDYGGRDIYGSIWDDLHVEVER